MQSVCDVQVFSLSYPSTKIIADVPFFCRISLSSSPSVTPEAPEPRKLGSRSPGPEASRSDESSASLDPANKILTWGGEKKDVTDKRDETAATEIETQTDYYTGEDCSRAIRPLSYNILSIGHSKHLRQRKFNFPTPSILYLEKIYGDLQRNTFQTINRTTIQL